MGGKSFHDESFRENKSYLYLKDDLENNGGSLEESSENDYFNQLINPFFNGNILLRETILTKQQDNPSNPLFKVYKVEKAQEETKSSNKSKSTKNNLTNKKRGRKNEKFDKIQHSREKNDDRMCRIQNGYFNFLINFLNEIMKKLYLDKKIASNYYFINLSYDYKKNINKDHRDKLNTQTIKEVLSIAPMSTKYSKALKKDGEHNSNTIKKIEKEGSKLLSDILDKNFLFFFENIYYKSIYNINLDSFGLESCKIILSKKVKMYENFFDDDKDENYKKKMNECAKIYFIKNKKDMNIE